MVALRALATPAIRQIITGPEGGKRESLGEKPTRRCTQLQFDSIGCHRRLVSGRDDGVTGDGGQTTEVLFSRHGLFLPRLEGPLFGQVEKRRRTK